MNGWRRKIPQMGRAKAVDQTLTRIYGVSWNHGSSPTLTRTDNSVGMTANAGVDANVVTNDFDTAGIFKDITTVTDALGNSFVRIPKFYIEITDNGTNLSTWRISRTSFSAGCYVPACFGSDNYAYIGAYNAQVSGGKLTSVSGVYPYTNDTIVNMRTFAQANGAGYQLLDIHAVNLLHVLFLVEFATLNSQSIMAGWTNGQYTSSQLATVAETAVNRIIVANATAAHYAVGQPISVGTSQGGNQIFYGRNITSINVYDGSNQAISFDGAPVNIAIGNMLYHVGWKSNACSGVVAKSGGVASLSDGLHPFMYRGIENLWGNVYQMIDGVNIAADYQAWVCPTPASYASNLFASPYEVLTYANGNTNGYIEAMGYDATHPYARFPITVGGSVSTYYGDYYYKGTGNKICNLGGYWNNASNTNFGLFCWELSSASTLTNITYGARLQRRIP